MTAWAGPLLQMVRHADGPRHVELHLPLAAAERSEHDAAWHEFLVAYDRFAALRPGTGFGTFVQQARGEPAWRPALLAWHKARKVAAWNFAKAQAIAPLLARHRGASVLVFTPDRGSAYAIAREHLVAPVTAELPRGERSALLAAFARGTQKVLVGPRLLDLGVPAGRADVGIVVGGGFGLRERRVRNNRVAPSGVVYELVAEATAEVGRARRFEASLLR
jgi:superfamily II DNA or RNA helicase